MCIICGGYADNGISILGNAICSECEQTIVNTDIYSDCYDEYKNKIREYIFDGISV